MSRESGDVFFKQRGVLRLRVCEFEQTLEGSKCSVVFANSSNNLTKNIIFFDCDTNSFSLCDEISVGGPLSIVRFKIFSALIMTTVIRTFGNFFCLSFFEGG